MPDLMVLDTPDEESEGARRPQDVALRKPETPVTLSELAALKGEALEVIEARVQILATLRKAAIRTTSPEDWVLNQSPDGRIVGFLQDAGGDRIRDLFGVELYDIGTPERIVGVEAGTFYYVIHGSGRCKLTGQVVEHMEGGRSSQEDFCKGKSGPELELLVRKAARANLDGGLTRELCGMKSVPIAELEAAWIGTTKRTAHCRYGRGFGSQAERRGATVWDTNEPSVEKPFCDVCGATAQYHAAGTTKQGKTYEAFWGCPKRDSHADQKWTIPDAKWRQTLADRETKPTGNGEREPGQEG